ncbi:hypothetical protein [Pedobacter sp. Leaf170]|uniref:hypothetical protein n=1 Tax=Pedobacter sp. Leaf170 TaxID=2876558 RepID=UPI001E42227D|nr:hypothetical protein [Pedobacter sp. Leaf170]
MKKLDSFEWLLVCLIVAAFITGLFIAIDNSESAANATKQIPQSEKLQSIT